MLKTLVLVFCFSTITTNVECARILAIFPTPSYSHQIVFQPIWKELSLKGHQVTVYTPNPLKDETLTNLTEIDLGFSYDVWKAISVATIGLEEHSTEEEFKKLKDAYHAITKAQMEHPEMQKLINGTEQFDLLIVEYLWPAVFAFKDVFNCPMVGITSLPLMSNGHNALGISKHPVLDPEMMLPFATDLTFKERVISTTFNILLKLDRLKFETTMREFVGKYFKNSRSVLDIGREVSMVIVNSNPVLQNIKPTVPTLVEISGIHIKPSKPLPEDLQELLDNSNEGVVYFSLGTNVKSHLLPEKKLKDIMAVFAELPYKVLWKFESDDIPNKPKNVIIRKWLPQQDVLRHKNVKMFVTQAGLQSLDEALHAEKPVLAIPFFGDQKFNADKMEHNGMGLSLNFHSFTREEFKDKIMEVAQNPKYQTTVKKLSQIVKDQPMPALEKAVWWIEYVLRHNGTEHLRYGGLDLPLYQYFLLDVIALYISILALLTYVLLKIYKHIVLGYKVCLRFFNYINIYSTSTDKPHLD